MQKIFYLLIILNGCFCQSSTDAQIFYKKRSLVDKKQPEIITYIWDDQRLIKIGDDQQIVQKIKKLQQKDYPYRIIFECDTLIQQLQRQRRRKFIRKHDNAHKVDLCRAAYLWFYGGTYSDLDYNINYTRHLQYIQKYQNFVSRLGNTNQIDNYYMSFKQPKNKLLKMIFQKWDEEEYQRERHPFWLLKGQDIFVLPQDQKNHYRIGQWVFLHKLRRCLPIILFFVCIILLSIYLLKKKNNYNYVPN